MRPSAERQSASPSPVPSRSVADVTSTPWAGSSTALASGRVGSSQWRCSPTSYSRPSIRSIASQSTKSGSATPPIRPSSAIQAATVSRRQVSPLIAPSTRARACESSQSGASSRIASNRRPSALSGLASASRASIAALAADTRFPSGSASSVSSPYPASCALARA